MKMRKITLLLSFVACVVFAQAQNLLVNPSFETWTAGAPTGWTITTPANAAAEENAVTIKDGAKSLKAIGGTGTYAIYQLVPVTPGKTYTLTMSYFIEGGDGTDARIWSNFKIGTAYLTDAEMTSAGLLEKLKGPGGSAATFYFPDVKSAWQTYTVEFVAPAGVTEFNMEFRTYKSPAVVYWDNMFFGEKTTGTSTPSANPFNAFVSGKSLELNNVANGSTVEIFNALGAKIQTSQLVGGSIAINLSKGLYIVRVGKSTQKFMVK